MHIIVPIKVVADYKLRLQLNEQQTDIQQQGVKKILNPFDAIALQEAVNIKKQKPDTVITTVFIGPNTIAPQIKESLALGADRAIHVTDDQPLVSLSIAKVLKHIVLQEEAVNLVLMGKQAIDSDANQTAQMLAALLNWPNVCFVSDLDIDFKNNQFKAKCEWDEGLVKAVSTLPAVISCDLRLNTPAPANMMAIMKAKQKPVKQYTLESLGLNLPSTSSISQLEKPAKRQPTKTLENYDALIKVINDKRGDA